MGENIACELGPTGPDTHPTGFWFFFLGRVRRALLVLRDARAEGGRAMNAVSPSIKSHHVQFARGGSNHRSGFVP